MPVGVPKVAFDVPGDDEASWIELYQQLFYDRLIFLGEEIESEISNQVCGMMIYLSLENKYKNLYLFINSPGGEVRSGMAIFDTMQFVEAEVETLCLGLAASMASLILVGGEITKRLAFPHARIMIHQPASSPYEGQTEDCMMEADELLLIRQMITNIYSQRTRKPFWQIYKDMERDFYMSAEEAQAYGIIDTVADSLYL
uniref:ATP-dependent Clp protease proteolytic subunit n=1 Tax=Vavilovia formosa TaxID=512756 RepID=A0A6G8QS56_9FABA|nr:ATP-dependent Clp protease proteolytic subunit [Vavilovia formosa]QIN90175.1 ATP-dependent Clp protease proteolytic subunit [Vavilovia formosa]